MYDFETSGAESAAAFRALENPAPRPQVPKSLKR